MKVDSISASVNVGRKNSIRRENAEISSKGYHSQLNFSGCKHPYPIPPLAVNKFQVSFGGTAQKVVFDFADGITDKMIAGGKGAGLAEMARLGLPVPPGFTIPTTICHAFKDLGKLPDGLMNNVQGALKNVEEKMGRTFGDSNKPLLISVRSGAPVSMPGMMDTILNVGLNDKTVVELAKETNNERFAFDSYRRLIQMFGSTVKGIESKLFEKELMDVKKNFNVVNDSDLSAEGIKKVVTGYKNIYKNATGTEFPQDVNVQLKDCIETVFSSWESPRAKVYRQINAIPDNYGTAVNVQTMVFGNTGEKSATGVAFSRHPKTGENIVTGDYLTNAQGEDVVAGIRKTKQIGDLKTEMPKAYNELIKILKKLEKNVGDMQDTEFTIQDGKLWMLQARNGKRTPDAVARIAVEQVKEGLISKEQALSNISDPKSLLKLLFPVFDPAAKAEALKAGKFLAKGTDCAGCATGQITFDPDAAVILKNEGKKVVLVRHETCPDDIHGMVAADGILTTTGGRTSHAAIIAMGMGKPAIVGCGDLHIDQAKGILHAGEKTFKEGDIISIDGNTGEVFEGLINTIPPKENPFLNEIISWSKEIKGLMVKVNADTPKDAAKAIKMGAEGIGLTRTEHMFMGKDRLPSVQKMILAQTSQERTKYVNELLPMQRKDFVGIFEAMGDKPVTVRLMDPPLHEFLPKRDDLLKEVIELRVKNNNPILLKTKESLLAQVEKHSAVNPMMSVRGCRLGITYPEVTEMQARAIIEAACDVKAKGIDVHPEIMVPNVAFVEEFAHQKALVDKIAKQVMEEKGVKVNYKVGTMIETPSAALIADDLVKAGAEFFSFGTNDLTQFVLGFDREEQKLVETYIKEGIFKTNPFDTIIPSVAKIMETAVKLARSVDPNLKIGVCGEHGGDPASIKICHDLGLSSVSASPLRLPTAMVSSAQSELKSPGKAHTL